MNQKFLAAIICLCLISSVFCIFNINPVNANPTLTYTATINPLRAAAGQVSLYTITITSLAGFLGNATINVPQGPDNTAITDPYTLVETASVTGPASEDWRTTGWRVPGSTDTAIFIYGSKNGLAPGESVYVTFLATNPTTKGSYTWNIYANQNTGLGGHDYPGGGVQPVSQPVVAVTPGIALTSYSGRVGDTIGISGWDFSPNQEVTATFNGQPLTLSGLATTDLEGGFSNLNFIVPTLAQTGDIVVTDQDGNSAFTEFTVNYALTITITGTGSGQVSDGSQSHFSTFSQIHAWGTTISLTAMPHTGSTFAGWSGDASGASAVISISMSSDKTVTATFNDQNGEGENQYTLTVIFSGSGSGKVSDGSQDFTSTSSKRYPAGTTVTLTQAPDSGSAFAGWSSDGTVNPDGTLTLTMNTDKSVRATFNSQNNQNKQYSLTINVVGSGTVNKYPDQATYTAGASVFLMANPSDGWVFSGWSGDLSGNANPADITLDSSKTVTATFQGGGGNGGDPKYTITAAAGAHGSISPSGATLVSSGGQQIYSITPDALYHIADVFVDGFSVGPKPLYIFSSIAADHTIYATFAIDTYRIDVYSAYGAPTASATVNAGTSFTASVTSPVGDSGHQWTCTGYSIDNAPSTTGTTYTFTNVQASHNITFNWKEQYHLTVTSAYGTVSGSGWYDAGSTAYATLSSGTVTVGSTQYVFTGWSGDSSGAGLTSNGIVMTSAKTATANWKTVTTDSSPTPSPSTSAGSTTSGSHSATSIDNGHPSPTPEVTTPPNSTSTPQPTPQPEPSFSLYWLLIALLLLFGLIALTSYAIRHRKKKGKTD
jgi:hypothetical protein